MIPRHSRVIESSGNLVPATAAQIFSPIAVAASISVMRKDDAKFFATVPANQVAESHGIPQRGRDTTQYVVDRSSPVFLAAGEERSSIQTLG